MATAATPVPTTTSTGSMSAIVGCFEHRQQRWKQERTSSTSASPLVRIPAYALGRTTAVGAEKKSERSPEVMQKKPTKTLNNPSSAMSLSLDEIKEESSCAEELDIPLPPPVGEETKDESSSDESKSKSSSTSTPPAGVYMPRIHFPGFASNRTTSDSHKNAAVRKTAPKPKSKAGKLAAIRASKPPKEESKSESPAAQKKRIQPVAPSFAPMNVMDILSKKNNSPKVAPRATKSTSLDSESAPRWKQALTDYQSEINRVSTEMRAIHLAQTTKLKRKLLSAQANEAALMNVALLKECILLERQLGIVSTQPLSVERHLPIIKANQNAKTASALRRLESIYDMMIQDSLEDVRCAIQLYRKFNGIP